MKLDEERRRAFTFHLGGGGSIKDGDRERERERERRGDLIGDATLERTEKRQLGNGTKTTTTRKRMGEEKLSRSDPISNISHASCFCCCCCCCCCSKLYIRRERERQRERRQREEREHCQKLSRCPYLRKPKANQKQNTR